MASKLLIYFIGAAILFVCISGFTEDVTPEVGVDSAQSRRNIAGLETSNSFRSLQPKHRNILDKSGLETSNSFRSWPPKHRNILGKSGLETSNSFRSWPPKHRNILDKSGLETSNSFRSWPPKHRNILDKSGLETSNSFRSWPPKHRNILDKSGLETSNSFRSWPPKHRNILDNSGLETSNSFRRWPPKHRNILDKSGLETSNSFSSWSPKHRNILDKSGLETSDSFSGLQPEHRHILYKPETIMFSATLDKEMEILSGSIVNYSNVVTNVGNGYNANTGVFTAPMDGYYVFHFHALAVADSGFWFRLYQNEMPRASAHSFGKGTYTAGGNTIGLQLKKGDRVYVKAVEGNSKVHNYEGHYYATFTGYLVGH